MLPGWETQRGESAEDAVEQLMIKRRGGGNGGWGWEDTEAEERDRRQRMKERITRRVEEENEGVADWEEDEVEKHGGAV